MTLAIICSTGINIGLEMQDYTVPEEGGTVEVCVVVTGGTLSETVTVTLETFQDSAIGKCFQLQILSANQSIFIHSPTDGEDYDGTVVQLMFNATVRRSCADIPITDDPLVEQMERFNVSISTDNPDIIPDPPTGVVTIVDNDGEPLSMLHMLLKLFCFAK